MHTLDAYIGIYTTVKYIYNSQNKIDIIVKK